MTNRTKAVSWILAVFVTGSLFGGTVALLVVKSKARAQREAALLEMVDTPTTPPQGEPTPPSDRRIDAPPVQDRPPVQDHRQRPAEEMRIIARTLQLDRAQRRQMRQIFLETRERYQALNRERNARQRQVRADMLRSIRRILTPRQQQRFQQYLQHRQRLQQQRERERRSHDQR